MALVVSGGHTFLVEMRDHLAYRLLGQTVDDAAGEAFDKVGRLLGLGYPGGPAIQRAAEGAAHHDAAFPRAWLGDSYDFSFSGLKTAARRIVEGARVEEGIVGDPALPLPEARIAELAWGFQASVTDVLVTKTVRAARAAGARSIVLGGGVAANGALRARLHEEARTLGIPVLIPRPGLCTDNGAMIGAAGARRYASGGAGRPGSRCPSVAAAGFPMTGRGPLAPRLDPLSVRRLLRDEGLRARHGLSQNFLADPDVLEAILDEAATVAGDRVLEIGPGLGILTGALLDAGAAVTAVELDRRLTALLRDRFEAAVAAGVADPSAPGALTLVEGDALDQDLPNLVPPPFRVVANLPYHITSPILHRLLGEPPRPDRLVLMVQREVAERIAAPPGRMSYLSVFVQYHAAVRIARRVRPRRSNPPRASPRLSSSWNPTDPAPGRWGPWPPRTPSGGSSRRAFASAAR